MKILKAQQWLITLVLLAFNTHGHAQDNSKTPDNTQPIKIQADNLNASEKKGKSVYSGNVEVQQGSLQISGERIEVTHPDGQLEKAITTGKPARFKRYNSAENAWVIGQANKIEYNTQSKTVLLSGNAQIEQPGKHLIKGSELFYDINKQTLNANSNNNDKQRVSVTFSPQLNENQTPTENPNTPQSNISNTPPEKSSPAQE